jgi:hypothetical protein
MRGASIELESADVMWNLMTVLALNLQRGDSLIAMQITALSIIHNELQAAESGGRSTLVANS